MKQFLLLALISIGLNSFSQFHAEDSRIQNEFIVMLKPAHTVDALLRDVSSLKISHCLSKRMNIWLLERNTISSSEDFLLTLKNNPHVKLAQFNHKVQQRSLIPNDTRFGDQWNMLNTGQMSGVVGADIDATEAWDINHENVTVCGDSIVIAIIDGMFDLNHEDINYFKNYNEIPNNSIDDDGNGYVDDYDGWNVYDSTDNVHSTSFSAYHSTHCAGISAAIGNNGKGVAGVCWGAKILPIVGTSDVESEVVAAYDYAMTMRRIYDSTGGAKGAYVVSTNSSFGIDGGQPADYPIWCAMYDSMGSVGIISAGATANNNVDVDIVGDIPTACPSNWLIGVTNTTRNELKSTAAWGRTNVDLGAPGTGILSTIPSPANYYTMSGTSMATPHVAGTVGAMYTAACRALCEASHIYPDSIALLVRKYMLDAAEWTSAMNNMIYTNGRLNLLRAVTNMRRFNCDSCNFNIDITKVPISCKGVNDGAMAVTVDNGIISDYNFSWSNALTTVECLSMSPGFYSVTVTDSTGCRRFTTAELHDPDSISINSIHYVAVIDTTPGNITVNATAGNEPLLYSLDGTTYQTFTTFTITTNGNYTIYVKNTSGCVVQQSVFVSGIDDALAISDLKLFPNPVSEELNLILSLSKAAAIEISISDVLGENIFQARRQAVDGTTSYMLHTSSLADGIYFLNLSSGETRLTRKFVVSR